MCSVHLQRHENPTKNAKIIKMLSKIANTTTTVAIFCFLSVLIFVLLGWNEISGRQTPYYCVRDTIIGFGDDFFDSEIGFNSHIAKKTSLISSKSIKVER